jgi:O-antigen/teichoic acid export membrane protein
MKPAIPFVNAEKLKGIDKANYFYVIINVALSAFSFIRSFVFMRVLDLKELGIISLVQTIFMFVGLLQIGLLNGGYRIVSLCKNDELEKTNNSIYSYIAILLPLGLFFCLLSTIFNWIDELSFVLLIISVVFGIFTLLNNWIHNALIGEQKLSEVNRVNLVSYAAAVLVLPLAFVIGFWGGMLVIMIQPLVFVLMALLRNKELLPTGFYFNLKYVKYILSFGFIPFLGGIFSSIYLQVERWSITEVLSVEALGGFYLVFLYVSLFLLIPNSINAIFFPKGVKAYSEKKFSEFKSLLKYYYLALVGYGLAIAVVTYLFLEPVVSIVFPQHISGVTLVYIILPGLILQSLSDPIGLILNSAVILRPMLIVNASNLVFNVVCITMMITLGWFSLQSVAMLRAASSAFLLVAYILVIIIIRKRLFQ